MDGEIVIQFRGGDHKGMQPEITWAVFVLAFQLILANLVNIELSDGCVLIEPDHKSLGVAGFGDEDIHNAKLIYRQVNGIALAKPVADGLKVIIGSKLNGAQGDEDTGFYYLLIDSRMMCARIEIPA